MPIIVPKRHNKGGRRSQVLLLKAAPAIKLLPSTLTKFVATLDPSVQDAYEAVSKEIVAAFKARLDASFTLRQFLRGGALRTGWPDQRRLERELSQTIRDWVAHGWLSVDDLAPDGSDLPNESPRILLNNERVRIVITGKVIRNWDGTSDISRLRAYIVSKHDGGDSLMLKVYLTQCERYLLLPWTPITKHMPKLVRFLKGKGLLANHSKQPFNVLLQRFVMAAQGTCNIGPMDVHHARPNPALYGGINTFDCAAMALVLMDPDEHRQEHARLADDHFYNSDEASGLRGLVKELRLRVA